MPRATLVAVRARQSEAGESGCANQHQPRGVRLDTLREVLQALPDQFSARKARNAHGRSITEPFCGSFMDARPENRPCVDSARPTLFTSGTIGRTRGVVHATLQVDDDKLPLHGEGAF